MLLYEVFVLFCQVDGVYTSDPMHNPGAILLEHLTYKELLSRNIRVMDESAITFCKEHGIPVVVFSLFRKGNITRAIMGEPIGTLVDWKGKEQMELSSQYSKQIEIGKADGSVTGSNVGLHFNSSDAQSLQGGLQGLSNVEKQSNEPDETEGSLSDIKK